MKSFQKTLQCGMTMLELSVILVVLIALAGLAMPYVGGTGRAAMCQATDATMLTVKEAIMGGPAGNGYYADLLGKFPSDKAVANDYNLRYLFVRDDGNDNDGDTHATAIDNTFDSDDEWSAFNPNTGFGWRGPYLTTGGQLDTDTVANLHDSFSNQFDPNTNPTGNVHVDHRITTLTQVFDAWHRPIILQVPNTCSISLHAMDCARLVSAGPGSGIEPRDAQINTQINDERASTRGDDRVLFLKIADPKPGGNIPCNQT